MDLDERRPSQHRRVRTEPVTGRLDRKSSVGVAWGKCRVRQFPF